MRLLHCADLHINSSLNSNFDTEHAEIRRNEILYNFRKMAEYAVTHDITDILICGDLFEQNRVRFDAMQFVLDTVRNFKQIRFFYLYGNHDNLCMADMMDELPENLYLFEDTWAYYDISDLVTISGIVINKSGNQGMYSSLELDKNRINIVLLHGVAEEKSSQTDYSISINQLKNKGIDYLALGHIHSYGERNIDERGYCVNPGCLEGRGFDEPGEHGFVVIDIDEFSGEIEWEFVPFAKRNLYIGEVVLTDCTGMSQVFEQIDAYLDNEAVSANDIVRFRLCGECQMDCSLTARLVLERYASRYFYVDVCDETICAINYSEYLYDKTLKGEFVRLVLREQDLSEEDKRRVIRCGIDRLGGVRG